MKTPQKQRPLAENDCYTIAEFCASHRISEAGYLNLRRQGLAPAELRLGRRVLITKEAAARWRKERTAATDQGAA